MLAGAFAVQWLLLMNILAPTWDAAFYYSYARSLAFDQDLSLENDLLASYSTASADFVAAELHTNRTPTGRVYAPFAIGSGLLWLPLLAILRLAVLAFGLPSGSGYEWYMVAPVVTFSALTGLLAFYAAFRLARQETGRRAALLATLTMSFATPLLYYQFREPLYAHVPSALLTTLFLFAWWRIYREIPSAWRGLGLGALLGLAALIRWQNAIYLTLPLMSATWTWLTLPSETRRQKVATLLTFLSALAGAFFLVFSAQLIVWQIFYGSWLTIPQGGSFMTWASPFIRELLFSPFRGLLPWMPIFGLACVGLVVQVRRNPRLVAPLIVLLILSAYVNASSRDWFAGGGYGPRRSTGELAILVLGYAWLLKALPVTVRTVAGLSAGVFLALHQWLLLRFALAEQIGGRVVSMAPRFEWTEVSLPEFGRQLFGHVPDIIHRPVDVFVLPGSPLHLVILGGKLPLMHLLSLLVAAAFLLALISIGVVLRRSWRQRRRWTAYAAS